MNSIDKLFTILEQFTMERPQWGVRSLAAYPPGLWRDPVKLTIKDGRGYQRGE
jgi:hypothetical protein